MPPKVLNVDVRSVDRDVSRYPEASDFSIDLGREFPNVSNLKLGSLEVPNTRYTVEDSENCMYMLEGFSVGTSDMDKEYNSITVDGTKVTVPATLMPIESFDGTLITTKQPHGLKNFMEWSAEHEDRPKVMFVGAEPTAMSKKIMRAGIYLHAIEGVSFPDDRSILLPAGVIRSFGLGSGNVGYIYTTPLHFQELLEVLNRSSSVRWQFREGRMYFDRRYNRIDFPKSPKGLVVSLGEILGLTPNSGVNDYAPRIPYVPKVRIPPGFYANPPSLIANAVEEAIMNRGLITVAGNFKITQMDALFSETISINQGLYTPELLQDTMQQAISSDISIIVEHVNDEGEPMDGWIRWTIRSEEGLPLEMDMSGTASAGVARVLGFRQRRYSGHTKYVGSAISVPATRNILPAPQPSLTTGTSRGPVRRAIEDDYRYNLGVYTITGTSPSQQRFTLLTEPSQSFAVPNTGYRRNFFESSLGAGIIDITTSGMAQPQSYGFRRGDVVRLTGVSEETVPTVTVINTGYKSGQIAGVNVLVGVVGVLTRLGGSNYDPAMPPTVTVLTPTRSGAHPTITPHVANGSVVACSIADDAGGVAEYTTPPELSVSPPPSWSVESATIEVLHMPERNRVRMQVSGTQAIAGVSPGRAVVMTNLNSETKTALFRTVSVAPVIVAGEESGKFEVLVEAEALDNTPLLAGDYVGATLRFGASNAVDITTIAGNRRVSLSAALPEAALGMDIMISQVAYANVIGAVSSIVVTGSTAVATHDNLLTAPIQPDSRIILRNAGAFNGVWIVTGTGTSSETLQGNQFSFSVSGSPQNFSGTATLGAMNCSTCASLTSVTVGTPQQHPTVSFDAVAVPYPDFTGVGGMCAYAPDPFNARLSPILVNGAIDSVQPCISGFLQTAYSTANLSSEGSPIVSFTGGETVSDVFNSATSAVATSTARRGDLVVPDDVAYVQLGSGERANIIIGRFGNTEITFPVDASDALVIGKRYRITSAGDSQTNWAFVGATSGEVGTVFTAVASNAGNNAGKAVRVRDYSQQNLTVGMVVTQAATNSVGTIVETVSGSDVELLRVKVTSGDFSASSPVFISTESGTAVDSIDAGDIAAANKTLRLSLDKNINPTTTGAGLILANFYFDGTFDSKTSSTTTNDWESVLDGNEFVPNRHELILRIGSLANVNLAMNNGLYNMNPVSTTYVYPSMFHVQWGGQYTDASSVVSSIGVSNDVSTRTGIVTYARFENGAFRYLIEYNHRGLNNDRGFEDGTANNGTIVLTFSRVTQPRTEYFGASASDLARHDPEMRGKVSAFTEQIILRRLGVIRNRFGESQYLATSQWMLEGQPYRILQFFDEQGNKLGETSHTHTMSRQHETDIFGKLIIPSAYNTVRFQALELAFTRPKTLRVIRIRLLGYDEMPYPLHGRELTFSLLLTCNMELQ